MSAVEWPTGLDPQPYRDAAADDAVVRALLEARADYYGTEAEVRGTLYEQAAQRVELGQIAASARTHWPSLNYREIGDSYDVAEMLCPTCVRYRDEQKIVYHFDSGETYFDDCPWWYERFEKGGPPEYERERWSAHGSDENEHSGFMRRTLGIDNEGTDLNWDRLWAEDDRVEWLIPDVLEVGQFGSIYGMPKCGKSLLMLEWAAGLARDGKRVLYVDKENVPIEVRRRLTSMGYRPESLQNLKYESMPAWGPIDTEAGAQALIRAAGRHRADLVVLDSYTRFFRGSLDGPQGSALNSAAYDLAIRPLRAEGKGIMRVDHTGHDGKRPRGTIDKLADVDHGWRVAAGRNDLVTLTHTENRTGRGANVLTFRRETGPLRHVRPGDLAEVAAEVVAEAQDAVAGVVALLDQHGIAVDWGRRKVEKALKDLGLPGISPNTVQAAINQRRQNPDETPVL